MIQYFRAGRRIREATRSEDLRAAQQLLTRRLAQCDVGEAIETTRKRALVAELWEGLERHYRINSRKSTECLKRRWNHLSPFFADLPAPSVSHDTLERYVDQRLTERASNATVNRELAALKTAFRLGYRNQKVRQVPVFPHLRENNVRTGFIEDADFEKLTASCSEMWLRLFLEIAYSFGWRRSEILNLRVGQVSFAARTIRLDPGTTKNDEGREVTMTARIYVLAGQAAAGKSKDDFLLTRDDGKPVRCFRQAWANLTKAAGLEGILIHDLRRSGARQLRRAGVPESVVQKIGGWKTGAMFKRYAIVSDGDIRSAISRLEESRLEQTKAENSHDFSHDSTDPSETSENGKRAKVN
ncbi:MAG: site-specific integrase [Terriglobales bacterium]|jgi:integrase